MNVESAHSQMQLQPKTVLDGFFIYSLLLDMSEHGQNLVMLNQGDARSRLRIPLVDRNKAMEGTGQEAYAHECDKCCYTYKENGKQCESAAFAYSITLLTHIYPQTRSLLLSAMESPLVIRAVLFQTARFRSKITQSVFVFNTKTWTVSAQL